MFTDQCNQCWLFYRYVQTDRNGIDSIRQCIYINARNVDALINWYNSITKVLTKYEHVHKRLQKVFVISQFYVQIHSKSIELTRPCKQYWLFHRHVQIHSNCIDYIRKRVYESMRKVMTIIYSHLSHVIDTVAMELYIYVSKNHHLSFNWFMYIFVEIYVKGGSADPTIQPPLPSHHPIHLRSCWPRELVKWLGRLSGRFRAIPGRF
jgi:hypothetical protein